MVYHSSPIYFHITLYMIFIKVIQYKLEVYLKDFAAARIFGSKCVGTWMLKKSRNLAPYCVLAACQSTNLLYINQMSNVIVRINDRLASKTCFFMACDLPVLPLGFTG